MGRLLHWGKAASVERSRADAARVLRAGYGCPERLHAGDSVRVLWVRSSRSGRRVRVRKPEAPREARLPDRRLPESESARRPIRVRVHAGRRGRNRHASATARRRVARAAAGSGGRSGRTGAGRPERAAPVEHLRVDRAQPLLRVPTLLTCAHAHKHVGGALHKHRLVFVNPDLRSRMYPLVQHLKELVVWERLMVFIVRDVYVFTRRLRLQFSH